MSLDIISVAPMLDCTDRHFRYLMRLMTTKTMLYTEMLTVKDVLEDSTGRVLELNPIENPIAIQLGGSDPKRLATCAKLFAESGYDEINLNVGCPSPRVQQGGMGACLMMQPMLVADCVAAMQAVSRVPVTVKCRLGVDEYDSYDYLANFINIVAAAGCKKFIIHARKAWLKGLSPKQNREIPPLKYHVAYQLKHDFPMLKLIINGGITSLDVAIEHLKFMDGVMIGRASYHNPYLLVDVDSRFYGDKKRISEPDVVLQYINYVENELTKGTRLVSMTRHLLGLFYNKPRASYWRKQLSCNSFKKNAGVEVIKDALTQILFNYF